MHRFYEMFLWYIAGLPGLLSNASVYIKTLRCSNDSLTYWSQNAPAAYLLKFPPQQLHGVESTVSKSQKEWEITNCNGHLHQNNYISYFIASENCMYVIFKNCGSVQILVRVFAFSYPTTKEKGRFHSQYIRKGLSKAPEKLRWKHTNEHRSQTRSTIASTKLNWWKKLAT